jgi:phage terminase large subunit-like protein
MALVGATAADARDVMVEGESGLMNVCPPWNRPLYEPSKRRVTWPNGAIATTYSADEPERLRGPQHDDAWTDEIAAWRYEDAWDNLMFGLRLGDDPRVCATTTPKPIKLVKELISASTTVKTGGSTYENRSNLAGPFLEHIIKKYEGTRLGRQELEAQLLDDNPDALWKRQKMIEDHRKTKFPELKRIVVAVDPPAKATGAEAGIIVGGLGEDGHGYILDDRSLQGSPNEWGTAAVTAYHSRMADRIVAEVNQGGDMVESTIRTVDRTVSYRAVHASKGKYTRAEPVAALYEQGKVHHVGAFPILEDQMCDWTPGDESPDRMDALVWLLTDLMLNGGTGEVEHGGKIW